METINTENIQSQMRKGSLTFATLLAIGQGEQYASAILEKFKKNGLLVVEGTLYPLLSRMRSEQWLQYVWVESRNGPPRKYYKLTSKGALVLKELIIAWKSLDSAIKTLLKEYEKNN